MSLVLYKPRGSITLPDNDLWEHRFKIRSESSGSLYTVAHHKKKHHWACDCPGWKRHRKCKHLEAMGLPTHEEPWTGEIR